MMKVKKKKKTVGYFKNFKLLSFYFYGKKCFFYNKEIACFKKYLVIIKL